MAHTRLSILSRLAAASGIAFTIIAVLGNFLFVPSSPPSLDASGQAIVDFYSSHRGGELAGSFANNIAAVLLLWFVAYLRGVLRESEGADEALGSAAYAGGIVMIATWLAWSMAGMVLAFRVGDNLDPASARLLFDLYWIGAVAMQYPTTLFIAASSGVMVRTGVVSRRFGWIGLVVALIQLLAGTALFFESGFMSPAGVLPLIAGLLMMLWILTLSIMLVRQRASTPAAAMAPA